MTVVIKEIRINTTVEKDVVRNLKISEDVYEQIKERIVQDLSLQPKKTTETPKRER